MSHDFKSFQDICKLMKGLACATARQRKACARNQNGPLLAADHDCRQTQRDSPAVRRCIAHAGGGLAADQDGR